MVWLITWTVLVIGALVLGFFLYRDLLRKASALLKEVARAAQVMEQLSQRTEALTEALQKAEEMRAGAKPEFTDVVATRRHVKEVFSQRRRKKQERARQHTAHRRTWRTIAVDPRFDCWRKK